MKSRSVLWLLLIGLVSFAASSAPAMANSSSIVNFSNRVCSLAGHATASPEEILKLRPAFDCGTGKFTNKTDMLWLVADIGNLHDNMAEPVMRFRAARQGAVTLHTIYPDGSTQTNRYDQAAMTENWRSPYAVALPLVGRNGQFPETVLISAENPWDPSNWHDIELVDAEYDLALHEQGELVSMLVTGFLLTPLLLSFLFFIMMRQRFVFYHSLIAVAFLVNHICWSGQIFDLFPTATLVDRSWIAFMALAVLAYAGCMLIRSLCNPNLLGEWGAFSLKCMAWTTLITTTIIVIFADQLSLTGSLVFHVVYGIMALTAVGNLLRCAVKGDRLALLQLMGLSVGVAIAMSRIIRALGWIDHLPIFDFGFYFAILIEIFAVSLIVGYRALQVRRERDDALLVRQGLEDMAYTDELTGLPNRRAFSKVFSELCAHDEKRDKVWALGIADIDHFKKVNDRYGHDVGDRVLARVAAIMSGQCRRGDYLARLGGEEFVLLISARTEEGIARLAQRLVDSCAAGNFDDTGHAVGQVTISMGLHFLENTHEADLETIFRIADKALYEAKTSGRNQFIFAKPTKPMLVAA